MWISSVAPEPAYRAAASVTAARSVMSQRGARNLTLLSRNGIEAAVLRELTGSHDARVSAPRCRQYRA
ncbi:hypothetical protein MAHJHV60_47170 [Mycobacterium avium subsp. hominissuis]